jgi:hypothetical protein
MTQQERSRKAGVRWQRLISEQAQSGRTVAAFCRKRKLCASHFFWWKKRLHERSAEKFVEVNLATVSAEPSTPSDARVEIRLRNGRSLVVGRGFDVEQVRMLVAVVEAG